MSDHLRPPTPSFLGKIKGKIKDKLRSTKPSPTSSPQPSRSPTPAPPDEQEGDKTHAPGPDAGQSKPSSNKQEEFKTATLGPTTAQSMSSSNRQEEDTTVGRTMAKITQTHSPAPSLQPYGSRIPVLASSHGSAGATASLRPSPAPELRGIETKAVPLTGSDTAKTDHWDTVESVRRTINMTVHGGTGGPGGRGEHGGHGGTGEGPKFTFTNSNVNLTDPHRAHLQSIKEKLTNHIAANHKHTDQEKSLCAENTRVEIQNQIMRWLSDSTEEQIFWITGIAGSGKSTLSATIVNNLRKKKTPVAAQFFISRNIPETVAPKKLVPTIALQLAEFSPVAAHRIEAVLKDGFPGSQEEEVKELLLAPIWEICKSYDRVIILIDALDELEDAAVVIPKLLALLAPRSTNSDLPDKLRVIVTSRPEYWAVISSYDSLNHAVFKQEALTTDKDEFRSFIVARFQEIKKDLNKKGPGWDNWPSDNQVSKLSEAADGLFHYAATALQWIKQQIQRDGTTAKGWVFDKFNKLGTGDLEELYKVILTSFENIEVGAQDPEQRENRLRGFRDVIGTILVLYEPLTIGQIIALLSSQEHFDVENFLCRQFCSVLIPGTSTSFERATPQMHKSFRDYIMNEHAPPQQFWIHMGQAHFVTAKSCLEVIVKGGSQSNAVMKYVVGHWYKHLRQAVDGGATFQDEGIWDLLGSMGKEEVVGGWKGKALDVFIDVGTVGWRLLERGTDAARVEKISRILIKAKEVRALVFLCCRSLPRSLPLTHFPSSSWLQKEVRAAPLSPVLASLTSCPLLASRSWCLVRAAPLSPVLASLTSRPLLASRDRCEVRAASLSPVLASLTSRPLLASRDRCVPLLCRPVLASLTSRPLLASSWCEVRAAPLSLGLALLTSRPLLASRRRCLVRAVPLSPVLASLTSHPLLASSCWCPVRAAPLSPVLALLTSRPLLASIGACRSSPVRAAPLSPEVRAAPLLPVLALLTSRPLLASSCWCEVRAAPLSPVLASLTSPSSSCLQELVRATPLSPVLASLTSRPLLASSRCSVRAAPLSPVLASLTSRPPLASSRRCLVRAAPLSPVLASLTSRPLLASSRWCRVHAAPLSPVLASLTSRPLLASSRWCSVRAAPLSPVLASLTSRPLLASSRCEVRAAPLSPVLASLTSHPLLASRDWCVPLLCRWSLPRLLPRPLLASSWFVPLLCRRSLPCGLPVLFLPLEMRAAPLLPVLASLTSRPLLASSRWCEVRAAPLSPLVCAAPLSPVLASLTSRPLLASSCWCRVRAAPLSLVLASLTSRPLLASRSWCEVRAAPLSPVLASLTSHPLLASSRWCEVRAAPLSPVLASLTSRLLLASSRRCVPLLCRWSLDWCLVRAAPLSPVLASLTSRPLLAFRECEVRAAPLSPVLASLTSRPLLASSWRCSVRAAPLLPVLASLTSCPLLVSIGACRSSVAGPCLADFPVLFLPLAESACRSSVASPCLADFLSSSCL
ncbi:hypothetical protein MSAN_00156800 [Mycena sanguinolenta]|uniref:NACHT domain-containing protein n=1 Tax=Mycena sanguinolenta TaxID=230812 RepID=A0A8H6ZE51_9AGAR|nr:hypothetical protein MSAN_00156800 [Mycena sanguinolenta]